MPQWWAFGDAIGIRLNACLRVCGALIERLRIIGHGADAGQARG